MKFRPLYFLISLILLLASVYSIINWGFKASIDFAGGAVWEASFPNLNDKSAIEKEFNEQQISLSSISVVDQKYLIKSSPLDQEQKNKLTESLKKLDPDFSELRFETLGPSLGQELIKKTAYAVILSSLALLFFIARRFRDLTFGVSAVLAMLHDALILIGSFSLLGHFLGAEIDALFVTAVLTTLSSSVHDTVVTFDRIRELKRQNFKFTWVDLSNQAITETIVRSLNNSMTIIFMLFSLVMLGGDTTRWFSLALLIGVIVGTYSSTAVAIPLLLLLKRKK